MRIKLTNTLSGKLEIFEPLGNKKITMYVCGPTVYDDPHIGNARAIVVYDLLYRLLKAVYEDYEVIYVRNITDIDDKIIQRAAKENISIQDLTERVTARFHKDCEFLECISPTHEPKASEHLSAMHEIIDLLIEKGHAYESFNHVYFSVSSFADYGKLANREISQLIAGARIDVDASKKNAGDFVLWKPAEEGEPFYDSKWCRGRPGWHIECSAMSYKFLGSEFDIHGGGSDLMFPHHTNEIAQSCCAFPGSSYAKTWVHNGFVTVSGEKMSKSLGNFITIKNIADMNISGQVLRMLLLSANYRTPLDYSPKLLRDITSNIHYLYRALRDFSNFSIINFKNLPSEFTEPLLNDLNTSGAIAYLYELATNLNKTKDQNLANILYSCGKFLGLFSVSPEQWLKDGIDAELVEQLLQDRAEAKKQKNWLEADRIRLHLNEMGVEIEDKKDGYTQWSMKKSIT
ncbi:MAG: cysteine--tRNA ligase [Rickettsiaceae bacterium]|nr:cysteine--tRNA ligase [Rickettsiaceae bacterium]